MDRKKDTWEITSSIQFVDVADGIDESYKEKNSCNDAKVDAVDARALSLLGAGISANSINVFTQYRTQRRKLKSKARMNGWHHVGCLGTTARHYQDSYLRIMILSLVNMTGFPRFLGSRPDLDVRFY